VVKILSQAGDSLADVYDVRGSIAGIDDLLSRDISLIHEMGATIFAERFRTTILRAPANAIAQSTTFNIVLAILQDSPVRVLGVQVITDDVSQLQRVAVHVRSENLARDFPIWIWDGTNAITTTMEDDGAGVATFQVLTASAQSLMLPSFAGGRDQALSASRVVLRGATNAFGAGTGFIRALVLLAFPEDRSGLSNRGLPIPSW